MSKLSYAGIFILLSLSSAHANDSRKYIINPLNTSILGISISSSERDVISVLGEPKQIKERYSDAFDTNFRYLYYDGIEIYFGNGGMWGLSCKAAKCSTNLSVSVGDTKSMVIKQYGEGNTPYKGATRDSLSYPFKSCDCYLMFYFENNNVIEMSYFFDYA